MARKWSNLNLPGVAEWLSSLRRGQGPPSLPANYRRSFLGFYTVAIAPGVMSYSPGPNSLIANRQ